MEGLIFWSALCFGINLLDSVERWCDTGMSPPLRGGRGKYPYNRGNHLLLPTVLYVYADESGLHQDPKYCVVGGFIGAPDAWEAIGPLWDATLATYEVEGGFHAIDFFGGRKSYRNWDGDKRDAYLSSLLDIITSHEIYPIGTAVDVQAFLSLSEEQRRWFTGAGIEVKPEWTKSDLAIEGAVPTVSKQIYRQGAEKQPYRMATITFLGQACGYAPKDCAVHAVFDSNHTLETGTLQYFKERLQDKPHPDGGYCQSLTFASDKQTPELQIADLLVYLIGKRLSNPEFMGVRESHALGRINSSKKIQLEMRNDDYFAHIWDDVVQRTNQEELRHGLPPSGAPRL